MRNAYNAVNRARDAGLGIIKPGVDLLEVGEAIDTQFRKDGYEPASPSFGHAVGMELEDHHINGTSLVLEAGMILFFTRWPRDTSRYADGHLSHYRDRH